MIKCVAALQKKRKKPLPVSEVTGWAVIAALIAVYQDADAGVTFTDATSTPLELALARTHKPIPVPALFDTERDQPAGAVEYVLVAPEATHASTSDPDNKPAPAMAAVGCGVTLVPCPVPNPSIGSAGLAPRTTHATDRHDFAKLK